MQTQVDSHPTPCGAGPEGHWRPGAAQARCAFTCCAGSVAASGRARAAAVAAGRWPIGALAVRARCAGFASRYIICGCDYCGSARPECVYAFWGPRRLAQQRGRRVCSWAAPLAPGMDVERKAGRVATSVGVSAQPRRAGPRSCTLSVCALTVLTGAADSAMGEIAHPVQCKRAFCVRISLGSQGTHNAAGSAVRSPVRGARWCSLAWLYVVWLLM